MSEGSHTTDGDRTQPTHEGTRRRLQKVKNTVDRTNTIIGTIAIVVGWILGIVTLLPFHSVEASNTSVRITYPSPGVIDRQIVMQGIVRYLPEGKSLWADIQDLSDLRQNPNNQACSVSGTNFQCGQLYIGGASQHNHRFQLEVWIVGVDQIQEINSYNSTAAKLNYPGLTSPPDGTTIATSVQVLRR